MDRYMDGWLDEPIIYVWTYGWMHALIKQWMDGWTKGWIHMNE